MSNASRDQNNVPTMIATLNSDGTTIGRIKVDPSTHALKVSDASTGTDHGTTNAKIDENGVRCMAGVSSVDGTTFTPIYTDSDGNLLIDSA